MRLDLLIPILLSIPVGLIFYLALTRGIDAHLKSLREKLAFFFWPYGPSRMLIIQELDNEHRVFYDHDFEEIQTENKVFIRTKYGDQYVSEVPPSQVSIATSMFEARGPSNHYSPFAVAWRWVVAASILIYLIYYSLVVSIIPGVEIREVQIGLQTLNIAYIRPINPWEVMLSTTAFFMSLTWLLVNVQRMNDRTIMYSWYHAKGINPPHISIVPSPTLSTLGLLDYLTKLGRKIEINIPSDARDVIEEAIGEVKRKTGSRSLAAVILAKLSMLKTWRSAIAEVLREQFTLMKTGETHAAIRLGFQPLSRRILPILAIVFIFGLVVGYALGNAFSIGIAPPEDEQPPLPPGNQTMRNQTEIMPPEMPPPPTGVIIGAG